MRQVLRHAMYLCDNYDTEGPTKAGALDKIYDEAESALAAPPRNCDVYATADEAYVAWQKICENESIPPSSKVDSAFKYWLFTTAEEGGAE